MRKENVLFSIAHFIVALTTFLLGGFIVILAISERIRFYFSHLLFAHPLRVLAIGCAISFASILLFIALYLVNKKKFYQINLDTFSAIASVDLGIIQTYFNRYFSENFPEEKIQTVDVIVKNDNTLEIITEFPNDNLEKHKVLLSQMEKDLCVILKDKLGYHQQLSFTILS